ncbi:MAG: type II toxin-antitoxin system VapB family antitoxin [Rhizobiaceae bacterium]|nr:MAG: type II toxin-antitoxin system VapB family antitoxin [Rhizobiaceae bacterium]CAG0974101.1 Antitoxin VapB11 [Rhizobiaceae bacterium]
MRTNIDIDDELMAQAMRASGKRTKKETVEEALILFVRSRRSADAMRAIRGKIQWEGDLDAMRRDR